MHMKNSLHKQFGFTLAELMITVAIAGILIAIGLPSMREFIQNGRITSITNEMVSTLMIARSEAMKQNSMTCVCPAADGDGDGLLDIACVASNNWETGWIAFRDSDADCVLGADDVLLKVWDGTPYAGLITVRTNATTITAVKSVRFNNRGEPVVNGTRQQGSFSICDDRTIGAANAEGNVREAAAVVLNASGRARASRNVNLITYTAP